MLRTSLSLMLLGVLCPAVASAQTSLAHAPIYTEGATIVTEVEIKTNQTMVLAGMNLETGADNFIVTKSIVTDATPGQVKIQNEIDRMQIDVSLPGGVKLTFDTGNPNNPEAPGPLGDITKFLEIAKDSKWVLEIGADHQPKAVKFIGDEPTDLPEMYKADWKPERMLEEAKREIDRLPSEPVSKGDTWERNEDANIGQGQVFHMVREYTYLGSEEHNGIPMEKIAAKTKSLTLEVNSPNPQVQIKDTDLSVKSSDSTLWYHPELKRITESTDEMRIVGTLKLVVNGNELPAELDLTMKVTGKVKL